MKFRAGNIKLGALSPPLHEQMGVDPGDVELEQLDLDALNRLRIRGDITERVCWRAMNNLITNMLKRLEREGIIKVIEKE